ncbi:PREDICTED: transcobalamin-1 [Myotis brandtii]|uniref:transcobalamin-1 n=1 Tax=Myotis brandtii TaxID=109478 RepID=UPI0003BB8019|nr:PREDICTED: transcobalamin-1 [Myotis brandtii]
MRQSQQLPLVGLLLFSLISSQLCTICEVSKENHSRLNPLLNTMIHSKYARGIQAANVLLSLRLVGIQDQNLEQQVFQEVSDSVEKKRSDLTSGELALVILALRACQNSDESVTYFHLVSQLEEKFQEEIKNMGVHDGNPLTNYYQLSLDVLTLCLFNGSYSITEVKKYFTPENKNFYFGGQFSVDTGAMAVLALTCVKRNIQNNGEDLQDINHYIESLIKKILSEKKRNGLIGNTYSTGEAMQALFVSSNYYNKNEWNCQQTLGTVLKEISQGAFHMPIAAAQILPALMGKTYLDVNNVSSCASGPGHLNISIHEPIPVEPTISSTWISVNYTVQINETFFTKVTVPKGSVFLNVMEEAQKINQTAFRFKYVESSWGPYIISVQGLEENHNDRTYWQLLSGGEPVTQGVGSYVVHNGENLEVRWSKY